MRIAVIDGQGGGIGKHLIERLRAEFPEAELIALGTNAVAAAAMLRAGANDAASGENAIVRNVERVDFIAGTVSIIIAHAMLGELTPAMAEAVARSPAVKLLIPLTRSPVTIVGVPDEPLPHYVDMLLKRLRKIGGGANV